MNFTVMEIFTVFWLAALLWIVAEYFYYRYSKNHRDNSLFDRYREQ